MNVHKVVIADPSVIVLNGLTVMLRELPDFDVVFQSTEMRTVSTRLRVIRPEIFIVNPIMIDFSQRRMVRTMFGDLPDTKVVALVSSFHELHVLRQFHGVLEINDDLQRVKSLLNQMISQSKSEEPDNDPSLLSNREKDVLVCMAKGQKNNEIAQNLNVSVHTVITHRKNIIRKTGIKSVAALTVYAILNNLIDEKDIL